LEKELIQEFLNPGDREDANRQQGLALEAIETAEAARPKGVRQQLVHRLGRGAAILARVTPKGSL
jgi:hypothetical protein